jgi:hypothetical protein
LSTLIPETLRRSQQNKKRIFKLETTLNYSAFKFLKNIAMKKNRLTTVLLATGFTMFFSCQKTTDVKQQNNKATFNQSDVTSTAIQVYGAWHAGNDACSWATVRTVTEFDSKNHWLIDRGNGQPSVNLIILSFVSPLKLLNNTTDAGNFNGIPRGMTADIVNYFKSRNIRVMLSIGGITYVNDWNTALSINPTQLGQNAAFVAQQLGVGIEIDYEESSSPNLTGLQSFITAYRTQLPLMRRELTLQRV